jgi:hypothetical protein
MDTSWGPTGGNAALDNLFTSHPFMQLHIGAPGAAGTTNVAANTTRVNTTGKMAAAAAGSKLSNADLDWLGVPASETYVFFTLWSLGVGGTFGGSGVVVANPVTSGDNFRIPSGQLAAAVTLAS